MKSLLSLTRIGALAAAAASLILAGCAATRSASDYDPTSKFYSYSTFAFMAKERGPNEIQPTIDRLEESIGARLEHKGFTLTRNPASADAIVDFTLGTFGRIDANSYPAPYVGGWFWDAQLRTGPYWGENIDPTEYRDGILSIDIFDNRTHRPIWHGWSKIMISRTAVIGAVGSIERIVRDVLSEYPPGHMQ